MAASTRAEQRVELVMLQPLVLRYRQPCLATQTMRGRERSEQSFRAAWQIQEEKDTVHRCYVVRQIHEQWQVNCHTTAVPPRRRRELTSTDGETGAVEDWQEVHHGVMHCYEWLEQVIHRALQNRA